jgi:DNA (cytosine-5)-methyltransferase 1
VIDENSRIRKLTPLECERLQGFPDGWTEFGVDGEKISDTQRYKCLGNAVTVPVVRAIAEKLEEENRKISKTQRKKKEERK